MIKFTKEEISLCKKVAKKHRKEIKYGDWYISIDSRMYLWLSSSPFNKDFVNTCEPQNQADKIIPLWTISDCLEFLRERNWCLYKLIEWLGGEKFQCSIINSSDNLGGRNCFDRLGKTPLEACLKAVLAVLEEGK